MAERTLLVFDDREDAGRQLARALRDERLGDAVVVGLARGGVEVAAEVAWALQLPLDALAVRKVGHPLEPEYAIGAVSPGGGAYVRAHEGLTDAEVELAVTAAQARAEALDGRLHARHASVDVAGKTCLLVDDGLATGATMVAAIRWAKAKGARRVVVAVPVGAAETIARLEEEADQVLCLETPDFFGAVGFWYRDFLPVEDERVLELLDKAGPTSARPDSAVRIPADGVELAGDLALPQTPLGAVLFAHGSGSSRASPRNRLVARRLNEAGLATLLFDLLTQGEALDRDNVFDIPLLASRLAAADRWLRGTAEVGALPIGYFGASTGAAAALWAAADLGEKVRAVVSRGGRPDLARPCLALVRAPTLLVVGGADEVVLELNRQALAELRCE
jgi:predicted phosphoribosyltransferase/predicted alpha/beta-hydrolase family hydrolase